MMNSHLNVRPSPIAGTWYTANPARLQESVDAYIDEASPPRLPGEVVALVAPHAGHRYSGAVAGHAFKTVKGKHFDYVVVVSPSHQYYSGAVLTSAHDAYRTPLGDIPVDKAHLAEIDRLLTDRAGTSLTPVSHDQEHSLEIELPFLQRAIQSNFALVPLMLMEQSRKLSKLLGEILAETFQGKSWLMVASSDLSHFYPEPKANQLDRKVLDAIAAFSPERLFDLKDRGQGQACGLAAIATVLWASQAIGAQDVTILSYQTSAAVTGDRSSVVGYGAAAITRSV
jgi:AmmeMemoRadiSam system protein B